MKNSIAFLMIALLLSCAGYAQLKVGLPNGAPHASAILDASNTGGATARGFLAPQVALTASNESMPVSAPATGLLVYNTATAGTAPNNVTPGFYYWNGSQWAKVNTSVNSTNDKNIYEGDGTLTANRQLNGGGFKLNINTKLGVGAANPRSSIEVPGGTQLNSPMVDSGFLMLGQSAGIHMLFDPQVIQVKSSPTTGSGLYLNPFGGNVSVGPSVPATATLDVSGTGRIRTINQVGAATGITPLFADGSGNIVKSSAATTFGATSAASSASISNGASGVLTTNFADGATYKAVVSTGDGCGDVANAEYYIRTASINDIFAINGAGGILAGGTTTKSPTFTQVSRTVINTTWTGKAGCGDGSGSTAFNHSLTLSRSGSVFTLTVTNNGNIARTYHISLTRIY